MRCLACNNVLSDYEATRRSSPSKEFLDLCNHCYYSGVNEELNSEEREDLNDLEDTHD